MTTGIGLACPLPFGMRCWPGIRIGAFPANVLVGPSCPRRWMLAPYRPLSGGQFRRAFGRRDGPAPAPEPTSGAG